MTPEEVAAIRAKLGETRAGLAGLVGKDTHTVRDWELGRRRPDGSAIVLLRLLDAEPGLADRLRAAERLRAAMGLATAVEGAPDGVPDGTEGGRPRRVAGRRIKAASTRPHA